MAAKLIDGKAIAQQVRAEVARDVAAWVEQGHEPPGLATVLVGEDPASARLRRQQAEGVGRGRASRASTTGCPQDAAHDEVEAMLKDLAADPRVSRDPAPAADARRRSTAPA